MAEQDNSKIYVRETRTTDSTGTGMALLVGGLVVAVGFVLWLVLGGPGPVGTSEPAPGNTTNVTIEPPAAPAETATGTAVDPAPDAADGAAAPADGAAPAAPATPPANP